MITFLIICIIAIAVSLLIFLWNSIVIYTRIFNKN